MRDFLTVGQVWAAFRAGRLTLAQAMAEDERLREESEVVITRPPAVRVDAYE